MTTMLPATETTALTPEQLLQRDWATNPRWAGIERSYTSADVVNLRGSVVEEQTLAKNGAARLWQLLHDQTYVRALGALTGNQAVQQVKAGLQAIYLSMAGGRRRESCRPHLSRPEPVPSVLSAGRGAPDQQRDAQG
jgi:isocitrate lyase